MMVRREVFERTGMFSEEYFMYAEDLDLCRKAIRAGYNNYYIPDARIVHHGGKSSSPQTATVAKWHSMLQYFVKNHGYAYTLLFRGVMSVVALCRLVLISLGFARSLSGQHQFGLLDVAEVASDSQNPADLLRNEAGSVTWLISRRIQDLTHSNMGSRNKIRGSDPRPR